MLTDRERYLFDVTGLLVIEQVLSASEVSRLNEALDTNADRRSELEDATLGSAALAGPPASSTGTRWNGRNHRVSRSAISSPISHRKRSMRSSAI